MEGHNEYRLNAATMRQLVEDSLNRRLYAAEQITVTHVEQGTGNDSNLFKVKFTPKEDGGGGEPGKTEVTE